MRWRRSSICRHRTEPNVGLLVEKFSGIQNSVRVEDGFQFLMYVPSDFARRLGPPAFLRETNSVLARDHPTPGEHLREQFIEQRAQLFPHICVRRSSPP